MNLVTFVAAGASSATDGGSPPTPGLPTGVAEGDLMVCAFYSREVTDGGVTPRTAGWAQVLSDRSVGGLLAVFSKVFQSGDVALTFTLTGHAINDDCIAQIAAYRNADSAVQLSMLRNSPAATNIGTIDGVTLNPREVVLVIGGKLDDWTSVATLSGDGLTWVEIGEPDSTAGTDAGMVWDHAINGDTETLVTAKTFVVTGGTAVAGKGVMVKLIPNDDAIIYRRKRIGAQMRMHGMMVEA